MFAKISGKLDNDNNQIMTTAVVKRLPQQAYKNELLGKQQEQMHQHKTFGDLVRLAVLELKL